MLMEQPLTNIGSRLRQAREQRGVTLHDIANATKISMVALRAIERNDLAQLPGGIYARSYIRAFAAAVGLSPDEIANEYRAQFEIAPAEPPPALPHIDRGARVGPVRRLAMSVFGLGLAVVGWLWWTPTDAPPVPVAMDVASTRAEFNVAEKVALITTAAAPVPEEATLHLEIRLLGVCWISATVDGQLAIYRLMQPGERAVVEADETIVLRVGDADALAYSINGAPGRRLGESGEAVTVRITGENYQDLLTGPASSTEVAAIQG